MCDAFVFSIRHVKRRVAALGLFRRGKESSFETIVKHVQEELEGIGQHMGYTQIWRRLQTKHILSVKR